MSQISNSPFERKLRTALHVIIFEADTKAGKRFDEVLIVSIILSVIVVMLDGVNAIRSEHGLLLYALEWIFTVLFTIEYGLRLFCIRQPIRYAASTE